MMYYDSNGVLRYEGDFVNGYAHGKGKLIWDDGEYYEGDWINTSSTTPTLTIKSPSWNARCHATYFSVNRAPELDSTNSNIKMRCDIYRVRAGSTLNMFYRNVIDLYNHPLT